MRDIRYVARKLTSKLPITHVDVLKREISKIASNNNNGEIRILDIGAGSGWYWDAIDLESQDVKISITLMDGIEINQKTSRNKNVEFIRVRGECPSGLSKFESDSFHLVIAFDLIEHLTKDNGFRLLYEIDRIALESSIIFTPNGFVWQPPSANNEFNAHISGWHPSELRRLGWKVTRGHTGLKLFRGPYGLHNKKIEKWPMAEFDAIMTSLGYVLPKISFAFSAVKRDKNIRIEKQEL